MKNVLGLFEKCVKLNRNLPEDAYVAAMNVETSGRLADLIASTIDLDVSRRQHLLESGRHRAPAAVSVLLTHQLEIQDLKNKIQSEIQKGMEKTQREYFLREQLKAIHRELGEGDPQQAEVVELRQQVEAAGMPEEVLARATRELDRLPLIPPGRPRWGSCAPTWTGWWPSPGQGRTEDNLDIRGRWTLNEDHYGLEKVKDRIVEFLAVRRLSGKLRSPILCFVGPPGVGKTSLGRSIARAMGRPFVRVSLGACGTRRRSGATGAPTWGPCRGASCAGCATPGA